VEGGLAKKYAGCYCLQSNLGPAHVAHAVKFNAYLLSFGQTNKHVSSSPTSSAIGVQTLQWACRLCICSNSKHVSAAFDFASSH